MSTARFVAAIFVVGLMVTGAGVVNSQDYPSKTIRLVTSVPGGGSDFTARQVVQALSPLGQPVVVDNRVSVTVGEVGAKGAPDGYTLTVQGASLWIGPLLQKFPYEIERDFAPISLISREAFILTVHPSMPVKSVQELLALAKARPGEISFANSSPGSPAFLGIELLKTMTGIKLLTVPYKSTVAAVTGVLSGESQLTIGDIALVAPHTKSGKLRALAVTSLDASALAPGLPPISAAGLPGYEMSGATGFWSIAKTPAPIITRLNQEVVRYLNRPEVKERFLNFQVEIVASSPEEFGARIRGDIAKWGKVFKEAGIKYE